MAGVRLEDPTDSWSMPPTNCRGWRPAIVGFGGCRARDKQRTGGLVDTLVGCRCQPRFASLDHQHPARSAAANDGFAPSINCRFSDVHRGHFRFTPFHPEFPVLSTP
jgi:hypothetical protein